MEDRDLDGFLHRYGLRGDAADMHLNDHDALYQQAKDLVGFTTTLMPPFRVSWFQKRRIRRGLEMLDRVVTMNPENWAALWVMGKAHMALGDPESALAAFSKSHRINPGDPDVAREASISAMECEKLDLATSFAERALESAPGDSGLRANLALALLLSGRPQDAKTHIDQALADDPEDRSTDALRAIVDDVLAGRRSCPRSVREI